MSSDVSEMSWSDVIESAREKFVEIAPQKMEFTAERAFAVQLLQNNEYLKKIAVGNPGSLQSAVLNVAAIGLSLNPAKKQAYLIPRNVKQGNQWVGKVFLEPSYMGMCDLATMSGSIKWVQAGVVYENDEFMDNGPGEKPTHKYNAFSRDRGSMAGVYCTAKTADGDYLTSVMDMTEISAIRDRSEAWKRNQSGPWKTDFNEQAKKTVIRRGFKTWPKTDTLDRMSMAIQLSNENEGFEPIINSPDVASYTPDQKAYFDQLITNSDNFGMFLLQKSLEDGSVFDSLYNSFEKGTITKYKQIVNGMLNSAGSQMRDCIESINESLDDSVIAEVFEDMSDDCIQYIRDQLSAEADEVARDYLKQQAKNQANADI